MLRSEPSCEAPESLVKIFQETLASNPDARSTACLKTQAIDAAGSLCECWFRQERPTFGVLVDRLTQLYSDLGMRPTTECMPALQRGILVSRKVNQLVHTGGAETGLDVLDTCPGFMRNFLLHAAKSCKGGSFSKWARQGVLRVWCSLPVDMRGQRPQCQDLLVVLVGDSRHVYRKSETYPQTMPRKASKVA